MDQKKKITGKNLDAKEFYRKNYKKLMLVPVALFLASVLVIGLHFMNTGKVVEMDIDFEGGTSATLTTTQAVDPVSLEDEISKKIGGSVTVRVLKDYNEVQTGIVFNAENDIDTSNLRNAIKESLNLEVTDDNYSVRTVGPSMGASFLQTAQKVMILGFVLTGIVIWYTFKIPEIAIGAVLCGLLNIIAAIAGMNLLGLQLSSGTLAALLMFLASSIDDNILIITRILEKKKNAIENAIIASKTGGMMIFSSLVVFSVLRFATTVQLFHDFATVLIFGLVADTINTWFQNTGLIIWYVERKYGKSAL